MKPDSKFWFALVCFAFMHFVADAEPQQSVNSAIAKHNSANQLLVMLHLPAPHFHVDGSYSGGYADDAGHSARRRIAADIARSHNLKLVSDWPMPTLGVDCYLMQANSAPDSIMDTIARDTRVQWVQKLHDYHGMASHDPLYTMQPSAKSWHLEEIHRITTGKAVRVAIIDSGIDDNHPDLSGQVRLKQNFVDQDSYVAESHGTEVAGIVAAIAGNGKGIEGIASDAHLLALRACWEISTTATQCNSFTLGKALNFAILNRAQVINLSLSGPPDQLLQLLLTAALAKGIIIVSAVDKNQADGGFPASLPGVLAVSDGNYSGSTDSIIAPGRDIPTTKPGGQWSIVNGASFSCAHASGLAALLLEIAPPIDS